MGSALDDRGGERQVTPLPGVGRSERRGDLLFGSVADDPVTPLGLGSVKQAIGAIDEHVVVHAG